jgi:hypothetical protein
MDRFYPNLHPFPSFSVFRGFLYGTPPNASVSLSIPLIIAGIIRTFTVNLSFSINTFGDENMGIKEIEVDPYAGVVIGKQE